MIPTIYDEDGNPTLQPLAWYEERVDIRRGFGDFDDIFSVQGDFRT